MLVATLLVLNAPVYLFIGWLIFDTKEDAADTFLETMIVVFKAIVTPRFIRGLYGYDADEASGILQLAAFITACVAVVWGEYYLITTFLL